MTITTEQARQRLKTLPLSLQDAIFSFETSQKVEKVADEQDLSLEERAEFADAVGLVLLGFVRTGTFTKELTDRGIPPDIAAALTDGAQRELFLPLGSQLTQAYAPSLPSTDAVTSSALPSFLKTPQPVQQPQPAPRPAPAPPTIPLSPMPPVATPKPDPLPVADVPTPVFLHQETTVTPVVPIDLPLRFGRERMGDQIAGLGATPVPRKAARVELGASDGKLDRELKAFFAQKETPLPQQVNYVPPVLEPLQAPEVQASEQAVPAPDAWTTLPVSEQEPETAPAASATDTEPAGSGVFDRLIKKIAPWHYERFARGSEKAATALQTSEEKIVNYTADVAPQAPASNVIPEPTATPTPVSLDDVPKP